MTTSIILLEGPDLAGKSTLATRLRADTILSSGPPPAGTTWEAEYVARLFKAPLGNRVVLDRWHFGELVYPQIVGRPAFMSHVDSLSVDRVLEASCDVYIKVLLMPPPHVLELRHAQRGDDLFSLEQIMLARENYIDIEDLFDWVCYDELAYDKLVDHVRSIG